MPAYLVGYDLSKPGQKYDELFKELKKYRGWWHHLDSTWIVLTEEKPSEIRDRLGDYIDPGDELAVFGVNGSWATKGISSKGNDWLHSNL